MWSKKVLKTNLIEIKEELLERAEKMIRDTEEEWEKEEDTEDMTQEEEEEDMSLEIEGDMIAIEEGGILVLKVMIEEGIERMIDQEIEKTQVHLITREEVSVPIKMTKTW